MKNNSMIKYSSSIFVKIKNKIRSVFAKNKSINDVQITNNLETDSNEKARIMELYKKIKQDESIISTISEQDLYKIMLLLNEEITIISDKIEEKAKDLKKSSERIKAIQKAV